MSELSDRTYVLAGRLLGPGGAEDDQVRASFDSAQRAMLSLSRAIGENALAALMSRAVAQTKLDHAIAPELSQRLSRPNPDLSSLLSTHGAGAVSAALRALVIALLELLARLIGHEMSARIIEPLSMTAQDATDA